MRTFREDPAFKMKAEFLPDEVYGPAITSFPIACSDTLLFNEERQTVFLARRAIKPMKGLWVIGGRRVAGETPLDGVQRTFRRETGLVIAPSRFQYLKTYEVIWKDREQEPQDAGSHNINSTFALELTTEELGTVNRGLERKEYEPGGLYEFTREGLIETGVFPAVLFLFDKLFPPQ